MNNITIIINKKDYNIKIEEHTDNFYKDNLLFIASIGCIYDLKGNMISIKELKKLYCEYKDDLKKYIDGTYSVIIYDHSINRIIVFSDYFNSNQYLYYHIKNNEIVISNKLKKIIGLTEFNWELDDDAVKTFLKKGYIPNNKTLIKNIFKIPSKKELIIELNNNTVKFKKYKDLKKAKLSKCNQKIYINKLENICKNLIKDKKISMTISSGYDTNLLLYLINKNTTENIDTYCIGGKTGVNEIPDAEKICSNYKNVKFHSKIVDGNTLINYPEIVWALEGSIYERGIFLQYELGKMLKDNNTKEIILGECADQVLRYELYHKYLSQLLMIKDNLKNIIKNIIKGKLFKYHNPYVPTYEMASYQVIKKNGLFMNYFGINPKYPYLRKEFTDVSSNVVIFGDKKKKYHKKVINETLPTNITKILSKIGGATERKTLFDDKIKFDSIKNICKRNKYFKIIKFDDDTTEIDYYLKILYIELFKKIFIEDKDFDYNDIFSYFPELIDT